MIHPFRAVFAALIFFFAFFINSIRAEGAAGGADQVVNRCGNEVIEGCPCGKMPVCVVSDHADGFFSQTFFDQATHSNWEGFGQGEMSDFGKAMTIEMEMAAALAKTAPCVELVVLNSYHTTSLVVETLAEQSGLTQRIQDTLAAGDSERLKELYAELDKLFERFGIQDLPWRNPDLANDHLQQRLLSCATAKVELTGKSDANGFTISAETSSSIAEMPGQTSSAASSAPEGGIEELAKKVAGELALIQKKIFCTCQEVLERCNVTNFDLANQESECVRIITCCGQVTKEGPEKVKGLTFGETRKHEPKCCSPIARSRAGEQVGEEDEDDRRIMNEIWCPGTWNLRGADLDCDGIPNAKDDTPWPPGEEPPGKKP